MSDTRFALATILLLALFLRVYMLGGLEIGGAWDEGYSMIAATHVLEDRTFLLIPHMPQNDGIMLDKPPVIYYLGALSMWLFGPSEGSVRVVSILFGVLSIVPFYLLVKRLTRDPPLAILSAALFAFFPLHVAISRTYMVHVPALFFALVAVWLLIRGIEKQKTSLLVLAGAVTAVNLLSDTWFGVFPVAGTMAWKGISLLRSRESLRYYRRAVLSLSAGLLVFLAWPLVFQIYQDRYVGIHGNCYPPSCTMWDIIGVDMLKRTGVTQWGVDLSDPVGAIKSLAGRLTRPYWGQGHFDFSREFDLLYRLFFVGGLIVGVNQVRKKSTRSVHLFFLFWTASYLPIHLGKNMYTQYLILMVPVFSFYTALAVSQIRAGFGKISGIPWLPAGAVVLLCLVFFLKSVGMIEDKREYLYKTHYREIASYLVKNTTPGKVVCRNYPGLSYYLGGECVRSDLIQDLGRYVKANRMEFADVTDQRSADILAKIGCRDVSDRALVPTNSEHRVFDCRGI